MKACTMLDSDACHQLPINPLTIARILIRVSMLILILALALDVMLILDLTKPEP